MEDSEPDKIESNHFDSIHSAGAEIRASHSDFGVGMFVEEPNELFKYP
jgi:hypothetical protein